jgi:hypothetical protein
MTIYLPWNAGLGDHWATLSLLSWKSRLSGDPAVLATYVHGVDYSPRLIEIAEVLDACPVALYQGDGDTPLNGFDVWASPPWPTLLRWSPQAPASIVYQFDGDSSAADKNPPPADQQAILSWASSQGLAAVKLGKNLTVAECVRACSGAALFVGCCSGMSHLAHSVGTPVYLLEYGLPVVTCHRQKQFVISRSADQFIADAARFISMLRWTSRP